MNTSSTHSVSSSVIEVVADASDTHPSDLPEQLHDVVDPDALDKLFTGREVQGCVQFEFCDHRVTVYSDGTVSATPATD